MTQRPSAMRLGGIFRRANLMLLLIGGASFILYRVGLRARVSEDINWFVTLALCQAGLYLVSAVIVIRARPARSTLTLVIALAALFRLGILFAPPYLSTDIFRYVWDGRVQAAGVNPYRYVPADDALRSLRDEAIYPNINRADYAHTIYPPVAQAVFFLATRVSERVTWMKAVMVGFEALTVWTLAALLTSFGIPRQRVLIYAWHPLVVWEVAGSGHVDAAAVAFVVLALLARRRGMEAATGFALACAVLVKLFPLVLFPALYRRRGWKMALTFAGTVVAAYLPYLGVGAAGVLGYLPGYAKEEGIQNGTRFYLLSLARRAFGDGGAPKAAYFVAAFALLSLAAAWMFWKRERREDSYVARALFLASAFTVLLSPHFSWYFLWLTPFMCLVPLAPLFYLTTAALVLYRLWWDEAENLLFLNSIVYLPFALLCAAMILRRLAGGRRGDAGEPADKRVDAPRDFAKEPALKRGSSA